MFGLAGRAPPPVDVFYEGNGTDRVWRLRRLRPPHARPLSGRRVPAGRPARRARPGSLRRRHPLCRFDRPHRFARRRHETLLRSITTVLLQFWRRGARVSRPWPANHDWRRAPHQSVSARMGETEPARAGCRWAPCFHFADGSLGLDDELHSSDSSARSPATSGARFTLAAVDPRSIGAAQILDVETIAVVEARRQCRRDTSGASTTKSARAARPIVFIERGSMRKTSVRIG